MQMRLVGELTESLVMPGFFAQMILQFFNSKIQERLLYQKHYLAQKN